MAPSWEWTPSRFNCEACAGNSSHRPEVYTLRRNQRLTILGLTLCVVALLVTQKASARRDAPHIAHTDVLHVGASTLQVDFADGTFDLPYSAITGRIERAAHAVSVYYGSFPVARVRILVVPGAGQHGVMHGTTWGDEDGFPAFLRLGIGQSVTREELDADWVITHELVHTALPSLPDNQHWLEEGLASYVEPIARVQAGEMSPESIWADMVHGMAHGEPEPGDRGLNNTHTWGRTYWGGALFCLVADVEIRGQTRNRFGLQDALRAIVRSGGTIDKEWPIAKVLATGDAATGTQVLQQMYAGWSNAAVPVDLAQLWRQLGVVVSHGRVTFDASAPNAMVRVAITAPPH